MKNNVLKISIILSFLLLIAFLFFWIAGIFVMPSKQANLIYQKQNNELFWGKNQEGKVVVSNGKTIERKDFDTGGSPVFAVAEKNNSIFVVTENKYVFIFENEVQTFSQRLTSIPINMTVTNDGRYIAVVTKSALSSSVYIIDSLNKTTSRFVLDCDGIAVVAEYLDDDVNFIILKSDVQIVRINSQAKQLSSIILDDIPISAVVAENKLLVLCEDYSLRSISLSTFKQEKAIKFDARVDDIIYLASQNSILAVSYESNFFKVSLKDFDLKKIRGIYEMTSVYANQNDDLIVKTAAGNTYFFKSDLLEQIKIYDILKILFFVLAIVFFILDLILAILYLQKWRHKFDNFVIVIRKYRFPIAVLTPAVILVAIFSYYPAANGFVLSMMNYKPGVYSRFVWFQNFKDMFKDEYFWVGFKNLLIFTSTGLLKALIPPIFVAQILFVLKSKRFQYVSRILLYLPAILPGVAGLMLWTDGIYGTNGMLNSLLRTMDMPTVNWLGDKKTVVWMLTLIGFPWIGSFLIFYGALMSIPPEFNEAAKIEGCTYFKKILKIDLPLIFPQIKYVFIMAFIGSVQEFNLVYVTTAGAPGNSSYVPMLEVFMQLTRYQNYGLASAMGVFMFIILFGITFFNLKARISKEDF